MASIVTFLGQIGYVREGQRRLPFVAPISLNGIPLARTLAAVVVSVVTGARWFTHCQWLWDDHILHALLGLELFPGDEFIDLADLAGRGP